MKQFSLSFVLIIIMGLCAIAQPRATKVQLHLVPDHANALYKAGENAKVKIMATDCGMALNDDSTHYKINYAQGQ